MLGERQELAGREQAPLRVVPADERLDRVDISGRELDSRLVVDDELAVGDRAPQLADEREPVRRVVVVLLRVEHRPVGLLAVVHGHVCVPDEGLDVVAVVRVERDADARLDLDGQSGERERRLEPRADSFGQHQGAGLVPCAGRDDRELVSAQARHGVRVANERLEPLGQGLEEQVAALVAERVVDLLEAVEVEEQHGDTRSDAAGLLTSASSIRRRKRSRFGRPVSPSCRAWCSISPRWPCSLRVTRRRSGRSERYSPSSASSRTPATGMKALRADAAIGP